jgi:hypothetical protein
VKIVQNTAVESFLKVSFLMKIKVCFQNLPTIVKLNKSVAILDDNLAKPAVSFKKPFDVPLLGVAGDISDVNTLSTRHF